MTQIKPQVQRRTYRRATGILVYHRAEFLF